MVKKMLRFDDQTKKIDDCVKQLRRYNEDLCSDSLPDHARYVYLPMSERHRVEKRINTIFQKISNLYDHFYTNKPLIDDFVANYAKRKECGDQAQACQYLFEIGKMYLNFGIHCYSLKTEEEYRYLLPKSNYENVNAMYYGIPKTRRSLDLDFSDCYNRAIDCFERALHGGQDKAFVANVCSYLATVHIRKENYLFAIYNYISILPYHIDLCAQDPAGQGSRNYSYSRFVPIGSLDEILDVLPMLCSKIKDELIGKEINKLVTDVRDVIEKLRFAREKVDLEKIDAAVSGMTENESLRKTLKAGIIETLAKRTDIPKQEIDNLEKSIDKCLASLRQQLKPNVAEPVTPAAPATNMHRFLPAATAALGTPPAATTAVAATGIGIDYKGP